MCVLIHKPAGIAVPEPIIRSAALHNADGWGVMGHTADGETVLEREHVQLNSRIPVAGTDPETFAAKIKGVVAGQSLTMDITFPDNFEKEEPRGEKGTVDFAVASVLRITPPAIDDEVWCKETRGPPFERGLPTNTKFSIFIRSSRPLYSI